VDKHLVDEVVAAAARVVAGGAISANGHGNVSLRVAGAQEMYFTSAPSLRGLGPEDVVRVGLDVTLLEGRLPPIQGAVVAMHTAMYHDRSDVGCVVLACKREVWCLRAPDRGPRVLESNQ